MVKSMLLCPENPSKLASFHRKMEPRPLSDETYFMTLQYSSLVSFFLKGTLKKGHRATIKTFLVKGLDSSFRWNDVSLEDPWTRDATFFNPVRLN